MSLVLLLLAAPLAVACGYLLLLTVLSARPTPLATAEPTARFAVVVPAKGTIAYICPGFEELRARELIGAGADVLVWQEDESPFQKIVQALHDRKVDAGPVAIDDTTRFFVFDGVRQANPRLFFTSAKQVFATAGVPTQLNTRRRQQ